MLLLVLFSYSKKIYAQWVFRVMTQVILLALQVLGYANFNDVLVK